MIYKKDRIHHDPIEHRSAPLFAAYFALGAVAILIIAKLVAYFMSGSAAMLASLTDSIGDGVISLIAYMSIRISLMPADEDHRFGHGKIEGFSAFIQSAFLLGAGVFLAFDSFMRFFRPVEIDHHMLGIYVSIFAMAMSLIVVGVQSWTLKKIDSLIIEADQRHYMNDVLINAAVIVGLGFHLYTGLSFVDSILGIVIALYIIWTGFDIGRKATDMLMDREIDEEKRNLIIQTVDSHSEVKGMHDLRTRRTGMGVSISFDVELDPTLTLHDAHEIVRDLEFALLEHFPHADIIIHMDPEGDTYDSRHRVHGVHH